MILLIDNYDSFTYNLVQFIAGAGCECTVVRNDRTTVGEVARMKPAGIILSPGPGRPEDAGICVDLIRRLGSEIPILGVCLGHQAIGVAFGGSVVHAPRIMHGKVSPVFHDGDPLYAGIPSPFDATRYHSLVIAADSIPRELAVTARTGDGTIMGVRHRRFPVTGVQFHPESILTGCGPALLNNWLMSAKERR